MAHFAELDDNNEVLRVIVVANEDCFDQYDKENEAIGALFCHRLFGGRWKQTSYNGKIRKNYAGVGYIYDEVRDAFIPPQPYLSWVFDDEELDWKAPVPYPQDGQEYRWDEANLEWKVINNE